MKISNFGDEINKGDIMYRDDKPEWDGLKVKVIKIHNKNYVRVKQLEFPDGHPFERSGWKRTIHKNCLRECK